MNKRLGRDPGFNQLVSTEVFQNTISKCGITSEFSTLNDALLLGWTPNNVNIVQ